MASGKEQYVCRLMKAKCSCGDQKFSQYLNLKTDHGVLFNDSDHPLMNANDHVSGENIYTFGRCKSLSNPHSAMGGNIVGSILGPLGGMAARGLFGCKCEPLTPFPWVQVDEDYYIDGAPALTINSVLHCAYGGEITSTLEAEGDTEDSSEETQQEEEKDKKEQLPSEVQEKIDSFCDDAPGNPQSAGEAALAANAQSVQEVAAIAEMFCNPIKNGLIPNAEVNIDERFINDFLTTGKGNKQAPALSDNKIQSLDELIESMKVGGKAFIPQNIDNKTVLDAFDVMRGANFISDKVIEENAIANKAELMNAGYIPRRGECIENQALWGKVQFGNSPNSNMSYSGCEIIATYNALSALGEPTSADTMVSLISGYERDGAALNGEFGVAPRAIADYFIKEGYSVDMTVSTDAATINKLGENSNVVIATVYNNQNDITQMVHTVCITKTDEGKYVVHNAYKQDKKGNYVETEAATFEKAIQCIGSDPAAISVIGIKQPMIGDFPENKNTNWG